VADEVYQNREVLEAILATIDEGIHVIDTNGVTIFYKKDSSIPPLKQTVKQIEESLIKTALIVTNQNVRKAAKLLDIPRQTLQYKIQKYKL
jgi:transcriptional regulator with PAS, ATPase and Fis domain